MQFDLLCKVDSGHTTVNMIESHLMERQIIIQACHTGGGGGFFLLWQQRKVDMDLWNKEQVKSNNMVSLWQGKMVFWVVWVSMAVAMTALKS